MPDTRPFPSITAPDPRHRRAGGLPGAFALLLAAVLCLAALPLTATPASAGPSAQDGSPAIEDATEEVAGIEDDEGGRTVLKTLEHITAQDAVPILNLLPVRYRISPRLSVVVLRGTDEQLEVALAALDQLDRPPRNERHLQVTVYILAASRQGGGEELPAGLAPVARQLGELFGYSGFTLVDSLFLRTLQNGDGAVNGGAPLGRSQLGDVRELSYSFRFDRARVFSGDSGDVIRFDNLHFEAAAVGGETSLATQLRTDVEIKAGQKAVVGKATPQGSGEPLILVLEAMVE